jgi:hypothetical protein
MRFWLRVRLLSSGLFSDKLKIYMPFDLAPAETEAAPCGSGSAALIVSAVSIILKTSCLSARNEKTCFVLVDCPLKYLYC